MRREQLDVADLGQHHLEARRAGVRADAPRHRQSRQCQRHAWYRLDFIGKLQVEQLLRLVEQRRGERNACLALDLEQDVAPGHAGEALTHFLGADRVARIGQQLGLDLSRDDFRIDQNAVAVEDDEIEAIAHEIAAFDVAGFGSSGKPLGFRKML